MDKKTLFSSAFKLKALTTMITKVNKYELEKRMKQRNANLGIVSFIALKIIEYHEATISELSQMIMISPATMVPVIDSLERKNLVKRSVDHADRRRVMISLTPKGNKLITEIPMVDDEDSLTRGISRMGERKTRILLNLLTELMENVSCKEACDKIEDATSKMSKVRS